MAETHSPYQFATSQNVTTSPIRILCIDDDPKVSDAIARCLSDFNVQVSSGFFGTHGVTLARDEQPDLIITDYQMPQGDGEFVVEMVRRNPSTSDIPIIVLTGIWDQRVKSQLLKNGADEVLLKPIQNKELIETIGRHVSLEESLNE